MKKLTTIIVSSAVAVFISTSALSAGTGSSPKGKPFVSINNELVEVQGAVTSLQDQVDLLVEKVNSIEERVAANENAITTLQDQDVLLQTLIDQNITDIESIQFLVTQLQQANSELQTQIDANTGGSITELQTEIDANSALISTLQNSILAVESGSIALGNSLQDQINNNSNLIAYLQAEVNQINELLEAKQNLINGTCPNGEAIQEILTDGSVVCGEVGNSVTGTLESVAAIKQFDLAPNGFGQVYTYCPSGWRVTGSGYMIGTTAKVWMIATGANSYQNWSRLNVLNTAPYSYSILGMATCTRIAP